MAEIFFKDDQDAKFMVFPSHIIYIVKAQSAYRNEYQFYEVSVFSMRHRKGSENVT